MMIDVKLYCQINYVNVYGNKYDYFNVVNRENYKIIVTSKMFDGTRLNYIVPGYTG